MAMRIRSPVQRDVMTCDPQTSVLLALIPHTCHAGGTKWHWQREALLPNLVLCRFISLPDAFLIVMHHLNGILLVHSSCSCCASLLLWHIICWTDGQAAIVAQMFGQNECDILHMSSVCLPQTTYQTALAAVFVEGWIFILLSVSGARAKLITYVPRSIALSMSAGIGMFLAFVGLQYEEGLGVSVLDTSTLVSLGRSNIVFALSAMLYISKTLAMRSMTVRTQDMCRHSSVKQKWAPPCPTNPQTGAHIIYGASAAPKLKSLH